jgi:choline dehydrogenase
VYQRHRGHVELRSGEPTEPPAINFNHFPAGEEGTEADLRALVDGVQFASRILRKTPSFRRFVLPEGHSIDSQEGVARYVQAESWHHHACGTCKIGKDDDPEAGLDGDFQVRHPRNLRVVDASVFPEIPGFSSSPRSI